MKMPAIAGILYSGGEGGDSPTLAQAALAQACASLRIHPREHARFSSPENKNARECGHFVFWRKGEVETMPETRMNKRSTFFVFASWMHSWMQKKILNMLDTVFGIRKAGLPRKLSIFNNSVNFAQILIKETITE